MSAAARISMSDPTVLVAADRTYRRQLLPGRTRRTGKRTSTLRSRSLKTADRAPLRRAAASADRTCLYLPRLFLPLLHLAARHRKQQAEVEQKR